MKSFKVMQKELREAKSFKLPSGSKELKTDKIKVGSRNADLVYAQNKKGKVDVYIDGNLFSGDEPYKDLKSAEKEMKDIRTLMSSSDMQEVTIEEIINEINSRV
jgi:hypothetical protein|tara:strand:- start:101 stop:412 length:312 start_codon:yes stop_codon:yes gene_type:complete